MFRTGFISKSSRSLAPRPLFWAAVVAMACSGCGTAQSMLRPDEATAEIQTAEQPGDDDSGTLVQSDKSSTFRLASDRVVHGVPSYAALPPDRSVDPNAAVEWLPLTDGIADASMLESTAPLLPPLPATDPPEVIVEVGSESVTDAPRSATSTPDRFWDLTEDEMLQTALANSPVLRPLGVRVLENPASVTTVYDPAISVSDPFFGPSAALAEFDSRLSAQINSQNNDRVFNNATLGGDVQELVQDFSNATAGLQKRLVGGGVVTLNSVHNYDNNNRVGNRFPNYWESQYEAGVRQPLLQGAGREFNLIAGPNARPGFNFSNGIWIARLNNRITDAEFQIQLQTFVRDLYTVYWNLKQQYQNYESVLTSESLAYQTWQSVLAKADANVTGGEANKEAQARARYLNYRREVQTALGGPQGLFVVERQLRQMIGLPVVADRLIRPVDPVVDARFVFDHDTLVATAMANRTELAQQAMRVRQEELRLIAAKNFLLPQLDVIGRYRARGFGDDLTGDGDGDRFASAYRDLFSGDHQEFEFGVEMGVTAGRRQARAGVRHASLQIHRERAILAEQQRSVRHQIGNAHAEVESAFASMETSLAQVDAQRTRLAASQALFKADKLQIEFLLDAQEELLRSELQLAADRTRYALALVDVNSATGTLLSDLGIGLR